MTTTITIANSKGGVSKTTTTVSIAAALRMKGFSVLVIDMDGQGNTSCVMGAERTKNTVYEVLMGKMSVDRAIQHTDQGDIVYYDPRMTQLDVTTQSIKNKESMLKAALYMMKAKYDFVIIDTAPYLGTGLVNALSTSDYVLIPTTVDALSVEGIDQLGVLVRKVQSRTNKKLRIVGILPTRTQPRLSVEQIVIRDVESKAAELGTTVFENRVRNCSAIRDSQFGCMSIYDYNPKSNAARDYSKVTDELLDRVGIQRKDSKKTKKVER